MARGPTTPQPALQVHLMFRNFPKSCPSPPAAASSFALRSNSSINHRSLQKPNKQPFKSLLPPLSLSLKGEKKWNPPTPPRRPRQPAAVQQARLKIIYYLYVDQMFYISLCPKDLWEIHLFARNNLTFLSPIIIKYF
jgi:hypothetical protein